MKQFLTVFQFELGNYFKNKSYMISTILIAILLCVIMFLPRFIDMSKLLGTGDSTFTEGTSEGNNEDTKDTSEADNSNKDTYIIYDEAGIFTEDTLLNSMFADVSWVKTKSENEVKEAIDSDSAKAGFVVKDYDDFDYYVLNKGIFDSNTETFSSVMTVLYRQKYCDDHDLKYEEMSTVYEAPIAFDEHVLGKDVGKNYVYSFAFVIIVLMVTMIYGTMIATAVTAEKSNRSIEVLVTSTSTNALLFGKVFAGAVASIFQVGVIMLSSIGTYKLNQDVWGHKLDMALDIPIEVIITFAMFGIGGYLFYAFLYGAMGALVSRTEDINKTAGNIQLVIMIVYFLSMMQLFNSDGIVIKVLSFLPISSYSAMFTRVAMGSVTWWEVAIAYIILVISIVLAGIFGAKIYRMGTLRYGNPIKLSNAIKAIKKKSN